MNLSDWYLRVKLRCPEEHFADCAVFTIVGVMTLVFFLLGLRYGWFA